MMISLFWDLTLHVWLREKERKFTEEEEEELLKISCKTKRTLWELALTILAKIFITIKLLQKPYWVVELEDEEERRQRNKTKTVAARRDERRVGSLWNLPTYVPLPSAEISQEMIMMMLSLFWHTGKDRCLHLAEIGFAEKISKVSAANRLLNRPLSAATFARSTASFQIRRTRAPCATKLCVCPTLPGTRYSSFFGSFHVVILLRQVARTSQSGTEEEEVISRSASESDAEESHIAVSHLRHVFSPSPASLRPTQRGVDVGGLFFCFFSPFAERER